MRRKGRHVTLIPKTKKISNKDGVDLERFCLAATCEDWSVYLQKQPPKPKQPIDFIFKWLPKEVARAIKKELNSVLNECFLWNPNTRKKIELPPIYGSLQFEKCIITAPPTAADQCYVFFLVTNSVENNGMLLFCRPGKDQWIRERFGGSSSFKEAIHCDGKLYVSDGRELCQVEFDRHNKIHMKHSRALLPENTMLCKDNLVELCGELLMVRRKSIFEIALFKMNFSQDRWEKVFNISEDKIIFLVGNYSTSLSVGELGMCSRGNTIFFSEGEDEDFLYSFSLADKCLSIWRVNHPYSSIWVSHEPLRSTISFIPDESTWSSGNQIFNEEEDDQLGHIHERREYNDENQREISLWFQLPIEVQKSIYEHLSSEYDCINFQSVCKAWKSLVQPIQWKFNDLILSVPKNYPWFMFPQGNKGIYSLYDPIGNSMHRIKITQFEDCRVRCSKDGWLLVTKPHHEIFFFEPFRNKRIDLRILPLPEINFDGFCFTCPPTSPDHCQILGICRFTQYEMVICHLRLVNNSNWTYHSIHHQALPEPCLSNPVFDGQSFYYLGKDGSLVYLELNERGTALDWNFEVESSRYLSGNSRLFLVCHESELLAVGLDQLGKSVHLLKLDRRRHEWVPMNSLEREILFLSQTTCLVVQDMEYRKSNTIQFPMFSNIHGGNISYSLKNKQYDDVVQVYSSRDLYDTKEFLSGIWIQPLLIPKFRTVV